MEFPVKTDFFPPIRISNDERRLYLATVEDSVRALRRSLNEQDWKKTLDKQGVSFGKVHYIEEQGLLSSTRSFAKTVSACLAVCASVFAPGSVSEVLEAVASPVTEDYRKAMKFLHRERFLDGMCLHTIVPNGSRNAQTFTTIKWCAFDDGKGMNNPQFTTGTDYCFLEHSGIQKEDYEDEVFGFCVQESIVRDGEVPSLEGLGLRRGEFHRTGILVLPTDRKDIVQVSSILQMSLVDKDRTSNRALLEKVMERRVSAIGRIELLLERRRLSKLQFIPRSGWVADSERKACAVCVKPFSLRRKHHCRNCGEVVCSSCAPTREVDVASYGVANIRICTACVVQARTGVQQSSNQDIFLYNIRSTVSSRTSTISSVMTSQESDRRQSVNSDAYYSLSSGSLHESSFHSEEPELDRISQASSACSLSDFNVLDEPFVGTSSMASLASKKHILYIPKYDRETTANEDLAHYIPDEEFTRPSQQSISSSGSFRDLLSSIRDIKADLSVMSTMYAQGTTDDAPDDNQTQALIPRHPSQPRANTDVQSIVDGEISLFSSDTVHFDPDTFDNQLSHDRLTGGSCISGLSSPRSSLEVDSYDDAHDDLHDHTEEEPHKESPKDQAELQALQKQVEDLHRSLEDATSKLNYFQARTIMKQHVDSLERGVLELECTERRYRRSSATVDPALRQRKQAYHALLSELHEIMGLPALQTEAIEHTNQRTSFDF